MEREKRFDFGFWILDFGLPSSEFKALACVLLSSRNLRVDGGLNPKSKIQNPKSKMGELCISKGMISQIGLQ
jgi:hypothetical protein